VSKTHTLIATKVTVEEMDSVQIFGPARADIVIAGRYITQSGDVSCSAKDSLGYWRPGPIDLFKVQSAIARNRLLANVCSLASVSTASDLSHLKVGESKNRLLESEQVISEC
jgi:hypothetical protein